MTSNKAQKRAIRARMDKTGEHYTAARHHLLGLQNGHASDATPPVEELVTVPDVQPEPEPAAPALPPRVADPGMSDESILRGSGKTWDEWLALLDAWGARDRTHTQIARYVRDDLGVDGWWAQTVTVGYERARGMRAKHQVVGGFSASVSRTFPIPVERLFPAFVDAAHLDTWLPPDTLRLRTSQPNRTARFDVHGDSYRVEAYFTSKGDNKASVALQLTKLADANAVTALKATWKAHLDRLAQMLD